LTLRRLIIGVKIEKNKKMGFFETLLVLSLFVFRRTLLQDTPGADAG